MCVWVFLSEKQALYIEPSAPSEEDCEDEPSALVSSIAR